jgi:hypothetical protein
LMGAMIKFLLAQKGNLEHLRGSSRRSEVL